MKDLIIISIAISIALYLFTRVDNSDTKETFTVPDTSFGFVAIPNRRPIDTIDRR